MFDPFASKASLRWILLKLKEDKELDSLIEKYIREILRHRIIMSPSRGPFGEKGKDIVVVENEETGDYCSYIVKRGTLQNSLDGPFGILKQIEQAMLIDLEIDRFTGKRRTAVVAHNSNEGYRGAIDRFEKHCKNIEEQCGSALLLRPVERWDIEGLVNRIFENREIFKKNEAIELFVSKLDQSYDLIIDFKVAYDSVKYSTESMNHKELTEDFPKKIKEIEYKFGSFNSSKYNGDNNGQ